MTQPPRRPGWGEALPLFRAHSPDGHETDGNDVAGGRAALVLFAGLGSHPAVAAALATAATHRAVFDDVHASFYGVTIDPADVSEQRLCERLPGWRVMMDADHAFSRRCGAIDTAGGYRPYWLLLDRTWRVVGWFEIDQGEAAIAALRQLATGAFEADWAPVLMVPHVLEPEFCRRLIDEHGAHTADPGGVMREQDGMTRLVIDPAVKLRRDHRLRAGPLVEQLTTRLAVRLAPMIKRAFQFDVTQVERLLIGCYDAEDGGHFGAHRDDSTRGTVHRQFAVTINLNAGDYAGGELCFPEFGQRRYTPPTGAALVFSCSLLHRVMPVTRGRRYAMLPFLLDSKASELREANRRFVDYTPLPIAPL
ncbi:MAG: redoxin protein [Sphingomonas bacterium]|uniref:2OG-Fe(II) oxygenase family protein n=1 Tax=Sphingomonas bacterium TaxID=1895847 RepID=UPI002637B114|nr:2OG-Fe(II) oxygenase [Sphingomonas bacterium]MDB5696497.1 redoxin protein [Sphingomonas bacterium]